ncbi:MAG: hypothetical protein ACOYXU_10035, partial [Nitrospirota bacterium]
MPVQAYDGFDKLARAKIPRTVLEAEILTDSPLGYWPLDETSGSVMVDRSGNGYDGVYVDGTTDLSVEVSTTGQAKLRGIEFDGEHRGVVEDFAVGITDRPAAVEFVTRVDADNPPAALTVSAVSFGTGATAEGFDSTFAWDASTWTVSGQLYDGDSNNSVSNQSDDTAHRTPPWHVAYRRASSGDAVIYLDGVDTTTNTGTLPGPDAGQPGASIGARKAQDLGTGFHGFLAAVAVYDHDVSAARMLAHANAAIAPLDNQTTDQRIGYVLDEIDWPTNLRNLESGDTTLGPATFKPGDSALEYLRLIEATEDG